MKKTAVLSLTFGLLLIMAANRVPTSSAQDEKAQSLERVLVRMEAVGKQFRSFEAKFSQRQYVAVLQEFDTAESGLFQYARARDGTALLRQEMTIPAPRILTIKGGIATIFQPRMNQASIVNLGKNKDKAEYLALGIGQSPAKMRETFAIEYLGIESVDGKPCSILVLKPKSSAAAAYFSSFTLWINNATILPVQQKLQEPNGNYLLVKFSGEKLNPKIPESQFEQKLPKNVEIQQIK